MLNYLSEEDIVEYICGHMTPEPEPVTLPHIGFQVGHIVVYLREEFAEGVQEAAATKWQKVRKREEEKKRKVSREERKI